MRVVILGNWANCVGTDYCDALGVFDSLEGSDCRSWAEEYAWDIFEEDEDDVDENGEYSGEGPDYYVEEYNPEQHDMLKAGGGSFEEDFQRWENE